MKSSDEIAGNILNAIDESRKVEKCKKSVLYQIVTKYLNIELYEGFNIITTKIKSFNGEDIIKDRIYYINNNGYIFYYDSVYDFHFSNIALVDLFNEDIKVKPIPFQPRYNQIYYSINWNEDGKISIIKICWRNTLNDYLRLKSNIIFSNEQLAKESIPLAHLNLVGTLPKENQYQPVRIEPKKVKVKIE